MDDDDDDTARTVSQKLQWTQQSWSEGERCCWSGEKEVDEEDMFDIVVVPLFVDSLFFFFFSFLSFLSDDLI